MTEPSGVVAIDKPAGVTSFDVVQAVRRAVGVRRVGHAGTLDPFATGLLVVCVGEATKAVTFLMDGDKEYEATVQLGIETDTCDIEGEVVARAPVGPLTVATVEAVTARFVGVVEQVPPAYSAIKKDGKRLYELARAGVEVVVPPRMVRIEACDVLALEGDLLSLHVRCGKGTYIRSLGRDLGRALETVAHLRALRRTAIGPLRVEEALTLDELRSMERATVAARLVPVDRALSHLRAVSLDEDAAWRVSCGQRVRLDGVEDGPVARAIGPDGRLIAVVRVEEGVIEVLRGFSGAVAGDSR